MSNAGNRRKDHEVILAKIRSEQKAKQRRFNILLYGSFGLVLVGIITAVAIVITGSIRERDAAAEAAKQPISGVRTYDNLSRNHVQNPVSYPQQPGVGGDHSPTWTNCGIYTTAVNEQRAVHSLEHGAVWLTYKPGLPDAALTKLTELAKDKPFVLLSPDKDQSSPVVATAWGAQLALEDANDPRIPSFITARAQSPDAPEPGAPCTRGTDG